MSHKLPSYALAGLLLALSSGAAWAQVPSLPDSSGRRPATTLPDTSRRQPATALPDTSARQTRPDSSGSQNATRQPITPTTQSDTTQPATTATPAQLGLPTPTPATNQPNTPTQLPTDQPTGTTPPRLGGAEDAPRGSGKIVGVVVDSLTGKPVEFASIALINPETNRPIDGAVADDKGKFTMNRLPAGNFRVLVSFVGYRNAVLSSVKLQRSNDGINLGNILLAPEVRNLKEVVVTGQAAIVEEKVDRLVYNAERDLTSKGGDATDIMRKVPLLTVDLDGNVSLRGSSNVRVLINNKPSTIVASSVADALKQIPADMIKTVEVITSPSAKYDAEGSAGIINIITKKNNLQGFTLNLDSGVGNRGANLGLQGNLRTGKMGFSLNGFGRANYNVRGSFENRQTTGNTRTLQTANTLNQGLFGQYQLGWDFDINKTTALTASVRYGARNQMNFQDKLTTTTFLSTSTLVGVRDVDVKDLSGTVDVNLDFTKTFKPQQELSILTLFSQNNRTNNFVANILDPITSQSILSRERNDNTSRNQESTFQVDYQTPLQANQLLEVGGKGILRQVSSDYAYLVASGENGGYSNNPNRQPNGLDYDQNVVAGYISYTLTTRSKYTLKVGTRYEHTAINARLRTTTGEDALLNRRLDSIPNYSNLVPSINISKALKSGKTIKLAYNRRLQRPGIQFLNPNVNAANPLNIVVGNPSLSPELTDNFEFSTSTNIKSVYLNISLFSRFTNNSIESVRDTLRQTFGDVTAPVLQNVLRTTYANIGQQNSYGINLFGNATLFSKLQLGGGGDVYYSTLTNNSPNLALRASNSGFVVSGRLFASLQLKNNWGVQANMFARGRQILLQGYQGGFMFYSVGIRHEFDEKRGSFGLAGENFFNHPFTQRSATSSAVFSQESVQNLFNAGVRATFSYRFGKLSFDGGGNRRKRSVNNDDVKDGGGGDNGGQPQQQAPAGGTAPAGGGGNRRPRQ
ncbi:TonB-dependent receptor [Fibrella aestuarina BUZ 2]|uniref:TonB-dependent receptor n=1 Tax=Fibrella aestuarina BUZ 2 TaxID=1166018 RepID=I0KF66_9BACT|nr:outer membrane beta-barrel family protein [Fibrella aestuarina]CCH02769.1 TonB-dependent receptor [Fibrella aestuarina BUZ 2]